MVKVLHYILMLAIAALAAANSFAQQEPERDPFFSDGPRSTASTSATADAGWGRDPFSRPFEGAGQAHQVQQVLTRGTKLTGIIYNKDVRIAIIGGEAIREGSTIGDQKVADIRMRSIVLINSAGSREEVFLEDFSMRK